MSIYGYDPINETETLLAGLVQVDSALSSTSENPVQNKVIKQALDEKINTSDIANNSTTTVAGKVLDARQGKIIADEAKLKTWMGVCDSEANAQTKVATVDNGFTLIKGVRVGIKYANSNTFSATTSNPITLNVNNTGAYNIFYSTYANPTGTNVIPFGYAGRYTYYVFDGNYWVFDGTSTDAYYSAITSSEIVAGTSTASKLVRADYLKTGIETLIDNKHKIKSEAVSYTTNSSGYVYVPLNTITLSTAYDTMFLTVVSTSPSTFVARYYMNHSNGTIGSLVANTTYTFFRTYIEG